MGGVCAAVRRTPAGSFQPPWAPAPLPKSWEKSSPQLGWPRTTDSLCPTCVKEARARMLGGADDVEILRTSQVGEIQRDHLRTRRQDPDREDVSDAWHVHGHPGDRSRVSEANRGPVSRTRPSGGDRTLHNHGTSSIKWGRGSVLTIDLTNRCNMMCDPCFMDANQVGYVHELTLDEVKQLLDDAITIKPKRQMSVQFSGGEPTLSPIFLESVAYAREVGYYSVQAATNGIRFAQDPDFAKQAREAGLRIAYLQFDGIGEDANGHRKVGNLFDVKLHAIENLHARRHRHRARRDHRQHDQQRSGRADHQVRRRELREDQLRVVSARVVHGPRRAHRRREPARRRYTLSHLAKDVKAQTGAFEPLRDWFPLSAAGAFADVTDVIQGPAAEWGTMKCGCHPNCGIGAALMVSKHTKEWAPLTKFLAADRLLAGRQGHRRRRPRTRR